MKKKLVGLLFLMSILLVAVGTVTSGVSEAAAKESKQPKEKRGSIRRIKSKDFATAC